MIGGNAVMKRFRINNLVIDAIAANTTAAVNVTVANTSGLSADCIGLAVPVDAVFTSGLALLPVRALNSTTLQLQVVNATGASINAVDTFDFDVFMFMPTGNIQQTV